VVPSGGAVRQVEIVVAPERLLEHGVGLQQVLGALEEVSASTPGGFHVSGPEEYVVRGVGRVDRVEDLAQTVVALRGETPILVGDVAEVRFGEAPRRGEAALDGRPGGVLKVQKQAQANTLEVTGRLDLALDELEGALPRGMSLYRKGFRQADLNEVGLDHVPPVPPACALPGADPPRAFPGGLAISPSTAASSRSTVAT